MKKTRMTRVIAGYLTAATLLLGGCSESNIYFYPDSNPSGGNGSGGSSSDGSTLVTFHASIESRNMMTRSLSPIHRGIQAQISAFEQTTSGGIPRTPVSTGGYVASVPGTLQGINGFKMYLPSGSYDFYAVSDNTPYLPPVFTSGVSAPLLNGTDYLWWGGKGQDVTSEQAGIPIVFLHCATQVVFEVTAGQGITLNELTLAHVYPAEEGAAMTLATGTIPPTTRYSTSISKMGINGNLAQYIMLPVKTTAPLQVSFDVRINDEATSRTYDVEVPLPNGELKAGESYLFKAVIEGNQITFPSVSVAGWTDVDETGNPLYPKEN